MLHAQTVDTSHTICGGGADTMLFLLACVCTLSIYGYEMNTTTKQTNQLLHTSADVLYFGIMDINIALQHCVIWLTSAMAW